MYWEIKKKRMQRLARFRNKDFWNPNIFGLKEPMQNFQNPEQPILGEKYTLDREDIEVRRKSAQTFIKPADLQINLEANSKPGGQKNLTWNKDLNILLNWPSFDIQSPRNLKTAWAVNSM
jgi:hypothetical protein